MVFACSLIGRLFCVSGRNETSVTYDEAAAKEGENGVCVLELNPLYAILSSTVSFYLPCLAMLCIYYRLHRYARRQVKSIRMTYKLSLGAQSQATVGGVPDDERDGVVSPLREKVSDHKAAITLGIIMGVFLLSWSPFFTVNLIGALCGPGCVPALVFAVFTWLGYVNSTMNPVIYSIFNREFREAFRRVLADARRRVACDGRAASSRTCRAEYGAVKTSTAHGECLATFEDPSATRARLSLKAAGPLRLHISTSI